MTEDELEKRILYGFSLIPERLAEYKRQKGSLIVLMEEGKIVHLTPDEYLEKVYESRRKKAERDAEKGTENGTKDFDKLSL